ncbi:peptidoglycan-binding domain-containing protein [Rhizobium herbae]|uniref:Peptidoglycan hydrolase-like protein with peptidoglycan-binding domain n=1 Tax=Rhizobium herbae TaxID=508661 RepID=A0ABS4EP89_9HYPH|nr:peptidoglycan-binding protein [Rhizobium herbae]MBP1859757.1 peptidoglycan hydrolase-like protein with peptidoglycan-binding domain [Rhizobium herbae]
MTARKRKQPEKKKKAQRGPGLVTVGLAMRGLTFAGRLASRNPRAFGGSVAFAIVFSFVAANAMWYQPGVHPSPFLRTRLPFTLPQSTKIGTGDEADGLSPRKVTTFVIQREDEGTETASMEQPKAEPTPETAQSTPVATPVTGSVLVTNIQKELSLRGLYDGPADGKTGPKTSAAILRFEKQTGRPETGSASDTLLAALQETTLQETGGQEIKAQQVKAKSLAAAKPAERPYENVKGGKGELDPVAAAIRNAEIDPQYIPKVDIPASSELVMNIQKGLSNLAYSDVSVDGVAGEQTRSAIRHFEKHYRLPETGQPSDKVLKKMKEIGAL